MFRRAVLVAAAAVALILAPSAAMAAYNAPGFSSTVSDPTPATGEAITAVLSGTTAGASITLTITSDPTSISSGSIEIAGTKALTKLANSSSVPFTVTLSEVGTYTLTFTDAGVVVSTQTVTVHSAGANSGVVTAGGTGGQLSATGYTGISLAVGGGILLLAGAGALMFARRRKTATPLT